MLVIKIHVVTGDGARPLCLLDLGVTQVSSGCVAHFDSIVSWQYHLALPYLCRRTQHKPAATEFDLEAWRATLLGIFFRLSTDSLNHRPRLQEVLVCNSPLSVVALCRARLSYHLCLCTRVFAYPTGHPLVHSPWRLDTNEDQETLSHLGEFIKPGIRIRCHRWEANRCPWAHVYNMFLGNYLVRLQHPQWSAIQVLG